MSDKEKKNFYCLDMFPYPSGSGLHVGHPRGYTATDVYSRYKKLQGFNVLHPMGWDAFGLPAENYAIANKVHPSEVVSQNVEKFKDQLNKFDLSYDWDKEINTTDPKYYRWTQFIFLKLFERGLAYEADAPINFCPSCKTGLANEEVIGGKCERCGTEVERKNIRQWMLKITEYADRLLEDLDGLDWPAPIKEMQKNWIGRSEGSDIIFPIKNKLKYVLLHGYTGSPDKNFFPWLKSELEKLGHEVIVPKLPNSDDPIVADQVATVLKGVEFDENTVLVGHSLGGIVALKILEKIQKPIYKTILVASFAENNFLDASFPEETFNWKFDADKIKQNAGSITLLRDLHDSSVPQENTLKLHKIIGGELFDYIAKDHHFCAKIEPAILENCVDSIKVYTTRTDTLFGCTWLVLAPENPLLDKLKSKIENLDEVEKYIEASRKKSDLDRTELSKEKTGVELKGIKAINSINGKEIPVWIADYVLAHYGTGTVMAVPAHDQRDFEFAKKYDLDIIPVIKPDQSSIAIQKIKDKNTSEDKYYGIAISFFTGAEKYSDALDRKIQNILSGRECFEGYGVLINSNSFDGLTSEEAKKKITEKLKESGHGDFAVNYKLRDWVFSRQRYWGEPIPIVHCAKCGIVPVPESDLPVLLPHVEKYEPTGDGTSPLANESDPAIAKWLNTKCPKCDGPAKRETNTMPQWAGSCWYYIAYLIKNGSDYEWSREKIDPWLPVDLYVGGAEHAVLHLLYARFWHKVLFDEKLVGTKEPFQKLISVGTILGIDGQKMSKSRGNVISPDPLLEKYGSDALKMYELYIGPFSQMAKWNQNGIVGMFRFLQKVEKLSAATIANENDKNLPTVNKAIKKISEDIEGFNFNTAISTLIETFDQISKNGWDKASAESFLTLLSPFAPKTTSALADKLNIAISSWPAHDDKLVADEKITIAIQVNGKVRDEIEISPDESEDNVKNMALESEKIKSWTGDNEVKKFIYIKGKIVSIVV